MSSMRSIRRLAMATAFVGASAATSSVPAGASGDDGSGAVVETTGDPASEIVLPPPPRLGALATSVTDVEVGITAGSSTIGFGLRLASSARIDEVSAAGGHSRTTTFDAVELTSGSDRIDRAAFDVLIGTSVRQTYARSGRLVGAVPSGPEPPTDDQLVAWASVSGNLQGAQAIFPEVPVGVGAVWTVEQAVSGDSFPVTATYRYELTAVADGRYTASVSYRGTFDTLVDGVATAGTVAGLGSIDGSVDDPLDVSYRLGQTTDGTAGGNAVHVEVTVTIDSAPA